MEEGAKPIKQIVIGIVVVIALVLAIWSGINNFSPQGRTIGTLGAITEKTNNGPAAGAAPSKPEQREKAGDAAMSGAPADAGTK